MKSKAVEADTNNPITSLLNKSEGVQTAYTIESPAATSAGPFCMLPILWKSMKHPYILWMVAHIVRKCLLREVPREAHWRLAAYLECRGFSIFFETAGKGEGPLNDAGDLFFWILQKR